MRTSTIPRRRSSAPIGQRGYQSVDDQDVAESEQSQGRRRDRLHTQIAQEICEQVRSRADGAQLRSDSEATSPLTIKTLRNPNSLRVGVVIDFIPRLPRKYANKYDPAPTELSSDRTARLPVR